MSKIKKFTDDGGNSYIETFNFPVGPNNSEERLQLEARLATLLNSSKAAQRAIQAKIIHWPGDRPSLVSYVYGTYHAGNIPQARNYRELAQWTADHYTLRGEHLNPRSLRVMLSQEHSRKRPRPRP